jgi:hypothetical protein
MKVIIKLMLLVCVITSCNKERPFLSGNNNNQQGAKLSDTTVNTFIPYQLNSKIVMRLIETNEVETFTVSNIGFGYYDDSKDGLGLCVIEGKLIKFRITIDAYADKRDHVTIIDEKRGITVFGGEMPYSYNGAKFVHPLTGGAYADTATFYENLTIGEYNFLNTFKLYASGNRGYMSYSKGLGLVQLNVIYKDPNTGNNMKGNYVLDTLIR